jgi:Fe2+ or Zn2+ uptake regulation protein
MKLSDIKIILSKYSLKLTDGRVELIGILSKTKKPLSVEDVVQKAKKLDRANVYRNIKQLLEVGLLREVPLGHNHQHVELVLSKDHHHHLICRSCGKIEDIIGCDLDKGRINKIVKQSKNFYSVNQHTLDLYGVCNSCK